ncbi:dephospho-CoA kinase [Roseiconus nitratireducens]|uniref:Dephospho-CoA kinase n=1 Tax=Roseiconus nitratireducens TaxID=2605748 RepID=A0A5M6DEJ7_9BACT|nr:dephospho-CoA kinase [Roseiconus nitratireducens]KAA5545964.1 dephospho-CoA kinase [Roseiconus nitratireducens]
MPGLRGLAVRQVIVLGIVGTPAGGKSTVASLLQQWGAEWINADLIARECLGRPEVVQQLRERFGPQVLSEDQTVNRKAIANLVFGDQPEQHAARRFLESLVHPRTRLEIMRRIESAADCRKRAALLDVPLLFESGWDLACDAIWCVDATRENRLTRARDRGWDSLELDRRESNQLAIETKSRLSNLVMRNDSTLKALAEIVEREWDLLGRINPIESKELRGTSGRPTGAHSSDPASDRHCKSDYPD